MEIYAAFIRAINVAGTGKISKDELIEICNECGFLSPKTYIQSGNLIFKSKQNSLEIKSKIENALFLKMGKKHETYIRTNNELRELLAKNPFSNCAPNRVSVSFLDEPIADFLNGIKLQNQEEILAIGREIFIHYGNGMGASKLIVPALKLSTARNINTIEKVLAIADAMV